MEEPAQVSRLQRVYGRYMFVVGVGGSALFWLQAIEIFRLGSAKDVSLPALLVGLWAVSSWLVYGVLLRNWVLISANISAVAGAALACIGKLLYG